MRKKAPEPLCQNRHCKEDSPDMIESWDRKFCVEYTCRTCGQSWEMQLCGHALSVQADGGWCITCRYGDNPYH